MSQAYHILHSGSGFPRPTFDRWHPPSGEVTWLDADPAAVSTSGPSLSLSIDLYIPQAASREQVMVVRLCEPEGYIPTSRADYQDPEGLLSVTATVTMEHDGTAEQVAAVFPYVCFPAGFGSLVNVEVAAHDPSGKLTALGHFSIDLPEDLDRTPDLLSVMAHTMVALVRSTGSLDRDEVRVIRTLLKDNFQLDDLGDSALRSILKTAARTEHSAETLADVCAMVVPDEAHERFVNLLYAVAHADGVLEQSEIDFIDTLLDRLGIWDHRKYGSERLRPFFEELDVHPGATLSEVKKAYRSLVRDYHPDKVQHLAQGFQDFAHAKMKTLNEAYEAIEQAYDDQDRPVEVEVELDLD